MRVPAVARQEFRVSTCLRDARPVKHDNAICKAHGAEAVSGDERSAYGCRPLQRVHDRVLGVGIETAGGFVENQYRRVVQYREGDSNAVFLTAELSMSSVV